MNENPYKAPVDTDAEPNEHDEPKSISFEKLGGLGCTAFIMTILFAGAILWLLRIIYR